MTLFPSLHRAEMSIGEASGECLGQNKIFYLRNSNEQKE